MPNSNVQSGNVNPHGLVNVTSGTMGTQPGSVAFQPPVVPLGNITPTHQSFFAPGVSPVMANPLLGFVDDLKTALLAVVNQNQPNRGSSSTQRNQNERKNLRFFLLEVRARNLTFGGEPHEDVAYFFKKLEEIRTLFPMTDQEMIDILPELCTGAAKRFVKNNPKECEFWETTKTLFRQIFPLRLLKNQVKADMFERRQNEGETIDYYISIIKHMNGKLTKPMSDKELLFDIILDNLTPSYHKMIKGMYINSLEQLAHVCRKGEELKLKKDLYKPPPSRLLDPYPDPDSKYRHHVSRYEGFNYSKSRSPENNNNSGTSPNRYRFESPNRHHKFGKNLKASEIEVNETKVERPQNKTKRCFNCDKPGHGYQICLEEPKKFCFDCGKKETFTLHCPCKKDRFSWRNRSPSPKSRPSSSTSPKKVSFSPNAKN